MNWIDKLDGNVIVCDAEGTEKDHFQTPWIEGDVFKGIVELSLEIPFEMPHYKRD